MPYRAIEVRLVSQRILPNAILIEVSARQSLLAMIVDLKRRRVRRVV